MVRLAKDSDFDFAKNSWTVCFDDTPEFVDWNFDFNYCPENTVIAEYNGVPASVLQLIPYKINIGGSILNTCYISGVATMPEYRGKGLVRELFDFAVPHMKSLGYDISILIPAVNGMYEKFGYRNACERVLYTANEVDNFKTYTLADNQLIGFISTVYKKAMSEKSFYIERTQLNFRKILTDLLSLSKGKVLISDNGYAFAYPKGEEYEIWEICGDIKVTATPFAAPPVMARIINPKSVGEKLGITLPANDVGALTDKLFTDIIPKGGYINMLL